ncbi:MAG: deoxyribonuclease IV [Patescibacteria group bacterium]|nr:deoxyribonuclease IV [Patescibacteria group bacterium]
MQFGLHVSAAGGVFNAPIKAAELGCETFQFFTRSPRGGAAPKLTSDIIKQFLENCQKFKFSNYYVHAPYYINLASSNPKIASDSAKIIREELDRSSKLKVGGLMAHLGSAKELDRTIAINKVIEGLKIILQGYQGTTQFLIEISAGSGNVIGDTFEEIAELIEKTQKVISTPIGVCFDTAHAFASGYDLRTATKVNDTLSKFDQLIGLKRLKLIHGNDSKVDFNSHVDRHWHIGQGKIGLACFKTIINHPKLKNVDMILETPDNDGGWDKKNMATVKKLRLKN